MGDECTHWDSVVGNIARRLVQDDYPSGQLAELRRLDADAPVSAGFWQLVARFAPSLFEDDHGQRVLAATVRGMAVAHPFHLPMVGRRPIGTAMAEAEIAEIHLLRILRLGRTALPEELRRLARLMASKGDLGRFDWSDAAWLLATADTDAAERIRRGIARDYFRTTYKRQKTEGKAA